jgi:hypothetical protein
MQAARTQPGRVDSTAKRKRCGRPIELWVKRSTMLVRLAVIFTDALATRVGRPPSVAS